MFVLFVVAIVPRCHPTAASGRLVEALLPECQRIRGGVAGTIELLSRSLRDEGIILVGEPYWRQLPPTEEVAKECEGSAISDWLVLPERLAAFGQLGYDVVEMVLASQDSWDRYVAAQWLNMRRWDLGYVLRDDAIIAESRKWIEAAMASQRQDGWFGPRALLTSLDGKPDLWPHMVMLNILQSYYEFSGERRVLDVMTRYMKWENTLPASAFGEGYWPRIRAGDNIESAFWLYNRTGHAWLLDLANKIHEGMARWDQDVINWHNGNLAQGFRAGTVFGMQSQDAADLGAAERNYTKLMGLVTFSDRSEPYPSNA